ncbi:hypothetical protein MGG_18088 [Pyricularia oryzae 70-15]|uniref:Uncharacterized protein n=1 Tax=Pyricularia oryzae (strain 70-15 / ATCC MYA-4617 / FGSC 8958) TaxID=242507 RepID=G4NL82_PYRO7|nr:uncharacterized protein MGG_18088 [Pyricularia oryzae 70-15]EHA46727.1 hypothetical protein MGG_18088 [Pyricularia oryzae 70-15]
MTKRPGSPSRDQETPLRAAEKFLVFKRNFNATRDQLSTQITLYPEGDWRIGYCIRPNIESPENSSHPFCVITMVTKHICFAAEVAFQKRRS